MKMIFRFFAVFSIFIIVSCASNIPMTSSLNDFVMMGTKVNSSNDINFKYNSKVVDGLVKPFDKDKLKEVSGHPGYNQTESSTLGRMLKEYIGNKFTKISPKANNKIEVTLEDFWLEQYSTDGAGKQVLVALVGGEINTMCVAKIKVLVSVYKDGKNNTKVLSTTAEDTYVAGVGTGTSTSNIYRGKNSIEYVHASNINKANNKIIMMLNAYLEEMGF